MELKNPELTQEEIDHVMVTFIEKLTLLKKNFLTKKMNQKEPLHSNIGNEKDKDQIIEEEDEEDVKSISTDVSIYDIIGELKAPSNIPQNNPSNSPEFNSYL